MKTAAHVMHESPLTVAPEMTIPELARLLHDGMLDGCCVVQDGKLVGVVTSMDLIFQEKRIHLPTFLMVLDMIIPLENPFKLRHEMDKVAGMTVSDIMTRKVRSVRPETPLEDVASIMLDNHLTIVPVVDGERLVGVVSKNAMLADAFKL